MELTLHPLTAELAAEAAEWFKADPAGQREFGGFYGAHPKWWDLVVSQEDRHGWIVRGDGSDPVGFVDLETWEPGHISYYVRQEFRGFGLCPRIVRLAASAARDLGARRRPSLRDVRTPGWRRCPAAQRL